MIRRNWPKDERPREKLLLRGAKSLSDAELLAIFLRTGVSGKTAVDVARELLLRFQNLRKLLDSPREKVCQQPGLGHAKYAVLQAALEIGKRYLQQGLERESVLNNPTATKQYLSAHLRSYQHEVFSCLFLDNQHRVIKYEELFHGSIDGTNVYPREIVKKALEYNASAIILAHNHPSGVAEPSGADKSITQHIVKSLALVNVRVIDHIVIGDNQIASFAERGLL